MPQDNAKLPSTLQRSPAQAPRTYEETLESAEDQYKGDESRAHRVAYASLKHSFEKVGDHWEPKDRKGPSDAQSEQHGANASKSHLMQVAKRLDVPGRSRMRKAELVDAILGRVERKTRTSGSPATSR